MEIVKIETNKLISPEWNPREITEEELTKLKHSLEEFGYIEPIIVNSVNNHVVGGNQRLRALESLGYDEVDCVYVTIEDINREKACNVALNKISGDWDKDKLQVVLEEIELSPIDISLTGFDEIELTDMEITTEEPVEIVEDDYTEPDDLEVTVQEGDIYSLGNHRLMCGDSTKKEEVSKLMNGKKADSVFTDPPYDLEDEYSENIFKNTKPNAEIFIMHNERKLAYLIVKYDEYFRRLFGVDYKVTRLLNSNSPMGRCDFIAHFRKEPPTKFNNLKDRFTNLIECSKTSKADTNNFTHKHAKKIQLPSTFIQHFSNKKDTILDIFGGSGTTLIACEQTNRNCYMMELDPYYCQVIINRWETYTGKKATKINRNINEYIQPP